MRYSVNGAEHSMSFRTGRTNPAPAAMAADVDTFLEGCKNLRTSDWTILGAEYAAYDSDIFLPVAAPPQNPGLQPPVNAGYTPVNMGFVGRSTGGSRAGVRVYGIAIDPMSSTANLQDYRMTSTEYVEIDLAVQALADSTLWRGIDGSPILWKNYANVNVNAHWQKQRRG